MNTVVLEVRSLKETLADTARAMKTGRAEREARISFATSELLWEVLTAKRWELLKVLCGAGPLSIREAGRRIGRDVNRSWRHYRTPGGRSADPHIRWAHRVSLRRRQGRISAASGVSERLVPNNPMYRTVNRRLRRLSPAGDRRR